MIKVLVRTNLDLFNEQWPEVLPAVPNVGDRIQSRTRWDGGFQLTLEVYSVTWQYSEHLKEWRPEVELHIPKIRNWSITEFYEWYAPKVGRTVGAFI